MVFVFSLNVMLRLETVNKRNGYLLFITGYLQHESTYLVSNNYSLILHVKTAGLTQILEVLKQDMLLNDEGTEYVSQEQGICQPALEPSLRRSTLQQLAVMMRQQEMHEAFLEDNGLNLIVSLLR